MLIELMEKMRESEAKLLIIMLDKFIMSESEFSM